MLPDGVQDLVRPTPRSTRVAPGTWPGSPCDGSEWVCGASNRRFGGRWQGPSSAAGRVHCGALPPVANLEKEIGLGPAGMVGTSAKCPLPRSEFATLRYHIPRWAGSRAGRKTRCRAARVAPGTVHGFERHACHLVFPEHQNRRGRPAVLRMPWHGPCRVPLVVAGGYRDVSAGVRRRSSPGREVKTAGLLSWEHTHARARHGPETSGPA
jgi:hypothetical protein